MIEKFGSMSSVANALGISRGALSQRMNNKTEFDSTDIVKLSELLEIPGAEVKEYFFTKKV